jgi:hypothetical protein
MNKEGRPAQTQMSPSDGVTIRFLRTIPGFNEGDVVVLGPTRAKRFVENGDAEVVAK